VTATDGTTDGSSQFTGTHARLGSARLGLALLRTNMLSSTGGNMQGKEELSSELSWIDSRTDSCVSVGLEEGPDGR